MNFYFVAMTSEEFIKRFVLVEENRCAELRFAFRNFSARRNCHNPFAFEVLKNFLDKTLRETDFQFDYRRVFADSAEVSSQGKFFVRLKFFVVHFNMSNQVQFKISLLVVDFRRQINFVVFQKDEVRRRDDLFLIFKQSVLTLVKNYFFIFDDCFAYDLNFLVARIFFRLDFYLSFKAVNNRIAVNFGITKNLQTRELLWF